MKLKHEDLEIYTYSNSSAYVCMKITHIPTGATVEGEGIGQWRLRKRLIEELTRIVELLET